MPVVPCRSELRDDHRLHALAGRDHQPRHGELLNEVGAGGEVAERVLAVGIAGRRADQRVVAAGILALEDAVAAVAKEVDRDIGQPCSHCSITPAPVGSS